MLSTPSAWLSSLPLALALALIGSNFSATALELSAATTSILDKSKTWLSKLKPRSGDDLINIDKEPLTNINVASAVAVTVAKNFLSEEETALYRRNMKLKPAVGFFSGNRMLGEAYLRQSFLRKLIEKGGQQCPSEEYEKNLPSGVHILTNHVTETTDAHVDYNPTLCSVFRMMSV